MLLWTIHSLKSLSSMGLHLKILSIVNYTCFNVTLAHPFFFSAIQNSVMVVLVNAQTVKSRSDNDSWMEETCFLSCVNPLRGVFWANNVTSLCLSFLICKLRKISLNRSIRTLSMIMTFDSIVIKNNNIKCFIPNKKLKYC